jgi:hypothetical protein
MKTETNTKHTPGPWSFDGHGINTSGARLATINKTAQISTGKGWRAIGQPESDANAKLMAAAPELLACIEDILDAGGDLNAMDFDRYRSAIALATGN